MNYQAECLFPCLVHVVETELDLNLKAYCKEQKRKDPEGVIKSNCSGWQSKEFIDNPRFPNLLENILDKSIYQFFRKKLTVTDWWININCPNSYNMQHTHPGAHFSGVYYLQVPENSGNIYFPNPWSFASAYELEAYTEEFKTKAHQHFFQIIKPKEGMLLVFPSHLVHGVDLNKSEEDRISISFNARVID